jgi:hypothetical protein
MIPTGRSAFPSLQTSLIATALAAVIATPTTAQNLSLDKFGGGLGNVATFPLQGQPNEAYVVLLDLIEQSTLIPSLGVTLDITDEFAWFSFVSPGFAGVTATRCRHAATLIPNDPFLG